MTAPAVAPAVPDAVVRATGVPWRTTVLPLAVLLAAADQFWVVSLRAGAGAVERTSAPALSWLRETLMLLPAYAVGVVVALGLADRLLRGRTRGAGPVLGTVTLVAGAATVTGGTVLLASSLYDYRLQAVALVHHSEVHLGCWGACLEGRLQSSWDVQMKAVAAGVVLMAVTNLVLVAWLVALRGRPIQRTSSRVAPGPPDPLDDRRTLLVGLLVGAAVVHAAVVPEHLEQWRAAGVFFLVVAAGQLAAAYLLHRRLGPPVPAAVPGAVLVVSCGLLVLWAWSRTTGLSFGPEPAVPEAVGLADLAAGLLELAAVVVCLVLLRADPRRAHPPPRRHPHVRGALLASVVAVTALGVGGSAVPGVGLTVGADHADHAAGGSESLVPAEVP